MFLAKYNVEWLAERLEKERKSRSKNYLIALNILNFLSKKKKMPTKKIPFKNFLIKIYYKAFLFTLKVFLFLNFLCTLMTKQK